MRSEARLAKIVLGVSFAVAAILLLSLDTELTFITDDWVFLVKSHEWSADTFLLPFHGNLVLGLGVVYKVLLETFGIDSVTPYYVISISLFLTSAFLVFIHLRNRVGDWLAVAPARTARAVVAVR